MTSSIQSLLKIKVKTYQRISTGIKGCMECILIEVEELEILAFLHVMEITDYLAK